MKCESCNSEDTRRRGVRSGRQRWSCNECGKWDSVILPSSCNARILVYDIETTPMEVFVWGLARNDYISPTFIIKDWNVLSWSAKWLCHSSTMSMIQTPQEARARDDKRVLEGIWKLIDQADIIIAHNGDRFDIKKLNTRFILNSMPPPASYQSIDTLKVAKRSFAFSSNKLDYLGELLANRNKLETNFKLWKECLEGKPKALKRMKEYNIEDVLLLEEVYVELRPWIKSHPNIGIYIDSNNSVCPTCGSDKIEENGSYYTTTVNQYASYTCKECGGSCRGIQGNLNLYERKQLMRPLP